MEEADILFSVGFDVGTVGTMAGFCNINAEKPIPRTVQFPKPPGITYDKIPSKIILKASTDPSERDVVAFGFAAEDKFGDVAGDGADSDDDEEIANLSEMLFFSNFKKSIIGAITDPIGHGFENGIVDFDEILVTPDNENTNSAGEAIQVPLKEIISKFIKAVSVTVLDQINKATNDVIDITEDRIKWVLSVPAMFDEYSKQMMVDCGNQAGLTHCVTSSEPDCAATWFLRERRAEIADKRLELRPGQDPDGEIANEGVPLTRRSRYLLFDIGGGTTDVVYHEIKKPERRRRRNAAAVEEKKEADDEPFEVSERFPGNAAPCGALMVEEDFSRIILEIIFGNRLGQMRAVRPDAYITLYRNFFIAKIQANPNEDRRKLRVPSCTKDFLDGSDQDVNDRLANYHDQDTGEVMNLGKLNTKRNYLTITNAGWRLLHRRVLRHLGNFIGDHLRLCENNNVVRPRNPRLRDYVVFCGGFSKSLFVREFLHEFLAREFPDFEEVHLLKGVAESTHFTRPEQSVGIGAMFPRNICEFMSPAYYGFQCNTPWSPFSQADPGHVRGEEPNLMEVDVFQLIVAKYKSYTPGTTVEFTGFEAPPDVDSVTIQIFRSERNTVPRYVDEDGCHLAMSYNVPINRNAVSTKVVAVLQAGSIEVYVETDGMKVPCQLRL